jgi:hypothetical protein
MCVQVATSFFHFLQGWVFDEGSLHVRPSRNILPMQSALVCTNLVGPKPQSFEVAGDVRFERIHSDAHLANKEPG